MGRRPCCDKLVVKKGPWTGEEDKQLINFILTNGQCCWRSLPKLAGLKRCGKSCRLRWTNYLRPDLKRGLLNHQEEQLLIRLHARLGNRWSKIAAELPGRTDNEIKNHWNTHIKKKLIKMGIDPITHEPLAKQSPDNPNSQNQLSSSSSSNQPQTSSVDTSNNYNERASNLNDMDVNNPTIIQDNSSNYKPLMTEISSSSSGDCQSKTCLIETNNNDDTMLSCQSNTSLIEANNIHDTMLSCQSNTSLIEAYNIDDTMLSCQSNTSLIEAYNIDDTMLSCQSNTSLIETNNIDDTMLSCLWDDNNNSPWNLLLSYANEQQGAESAITNSPTWEDDSCSWLLDCQDFGIKDFGLY